MRLNSFITKLISLPYLAFFCFVPGTFNAISGNHRTGIPLRILRLVGGMEEPQLRRMSEQDERAAQRRVVIERLKAGIPLSEEGEEYTHHADQPYRFDGQNSSATDFFAQDDEYDEEPLTPDNPFRGWDPALLDLEDRGSSFDDEQNLFVRTGTEINPYYDDEYAQMQQDARDQSLDPLPDRCRPLRAQMQQAQDNTVQRLHKEGARAG